MSAVNSFAAGYLGARFFHYIFAILLITSVGFISETMGLSQKTLIEYSMICVVFPLIACALFRYKVFKRGLKSLFFVAYRNILIICGLAFAAIGIIQMKAPEKARALKEEELAIINSMPPILKDLVLTLTPPQMFVLMGAMMIVPAIAMSVYGNSVEKKYNQALYDRDVSVVRDGINQSRL